MKLILCYKRRPDMTVEAFQHHLAGPRRSSVAAQGGYLRYEQNLTKLSGYGRPKEPIFDGLEKFWFESEAALAAFRQTLALAENRHDIGRFADVARTRTVVADEVMIKDGPRQAGMTRLIEFLTRRPGMEVADFHSHWADIHGPLVAKQRQIRSYIQSHTRLSEYEAGEPDFDGVTEVWFDDTNGMREAASEPLWVEVLADEKNFVCDNTPFIISTDT